MNDASQGPMQGVRILDLGNMVAGPVAATILADQGAQVIKVEPPGFGDVMRYLGAMCNGVSGLFHASNRGKRSLALDLKNPEGLAVIHRLVADVDVVLHNFRAGVAERLGVDYATLRAINPELIYLWVNGFGASGPMHRKPAYDSIIQAFAGVSQSQADGQTGEPIQYYQLFSDKLTALTGAQAISAALFARGQGRGGQEIKLSMVESVVSFLWSDASGTATFLEEGAVEGISVARHKLIEFRNGWASLAPVTDDQFHGCCATFGVDSSDSRVATAADRNANGEFVDALFKQLRAVMLETDIDEGIARLNEADVPCAKAMHLAELPDHEQLQATGAFAETTHALAGRMVEPRNPPNFSATPSGVGGSSAALGEHTDRILEELGYNSEAIAALRSAGAVA
ncbi:MAG: CoA transferase [Pseudomonadota bacterium]